WPQRQERSWARRPWLRASRSAAASACPPIVSGVCAEHASSIVALPAGGVACHYRELSSDLELRRLQERTHCCPAQKFEPEKRQANQIERCSAGSAYLWRILGLARRAGIEWLGGKDERVRNGGDKRPDLSRPRLQSGRAFQ